jgi:hypothetical protein
VHSRRLVRHFLSQFVENDWSTDVDTHQTLALVAAGIVTIPLFVTVFMSMRYLTRLLPAAGWTETTGLEDQITFCVSSMLVAAAVAALEWDALALSHRDSMILGVLPVPHHDLVRAKVLSLVMFVALFVIALNLLPAVLHPALMVATLPLPLYMVPVLMAAHGLGTAMAAAFGFACVVGLREFLHLALGPSAFRRISDLIRSVVLLMLLVLLTVLPVRLSGRADWLLAPGQPPILLRPIGWFVATNASIVGRVLQRVPHRPMPPRLAAEEYQLRTRYERNLPKWTGMAAQGAGVLLFLLGVSVTMYVWNARRLHILSEGGAGSRVLRFSRVFEGAVRALIKPPPMRAGFLLLFRTLVGSGLHRLYLIVAMAAGVGLFVAMAPFAVDGAIPPLRTLHLAAQTLGLAAIITAFRAAIRTAADERAGWLFGIAETGHLALFRNGVRLAAVVATTVIVALLVPLHAAAWGVPVAAAHAANGIALGWLMVETVSASVHAPLITTIPPNDGLNTVGTVFIGALVIAVFVLARIERAALGGQLSGIAFTTTILFLAACVHHASEREHQALPVADRPR